MISTEKTLCTCESTYEYFVAMKEFWEEYICEHHDFIRVARSNIAQIDKDIERWKNNKKPTP